MRFRPSYLAQQQLTTYAPQHTDGGSYGRIGADADYMGGIFGDPSAYGDAPGAPAAPAAPGAPGVSADPLAMGLSLVTGLATSWMGNRAATKQAQYQAQTAAYQAKAAAYQAQAAALAGGGQQQAAGIPTWVWVAGGVTALVLIGGVGVVAARRRKGGK